MASPWQLALGPEFERLDPRLRAYFDEIPAGRVGVGEGVFEVIGPRWPWLTPLFAAIGRRDALFARRGRNRPFRIENRPSAGGFAGLAAIRRVDFGDAELRMVDLVAAVRVGEHVRLADRLGRGGTMLAVLGAEVVDGGLRLRALALHLRLGPFRVRLPRLLTPRLELTERIGPDGRQRVRLAASVPVLGTVYEYGGSFDYRIETDRRIESDVDDEPER